MSRVAMAGERGVPDENEAYDWFDASPSCTPAAGWLPCH